MTKEVFLSISGLQLTEDQSEDVEVVTTGDYYKKNDKHYIIYDEMVEGLTGHIRNTIKISPDALEVSKKGMTTSNMVFEKERRNVSMYQTPFGGMTVGILTHDIDVREEEDDISIDVTYALELNDQYLEDRTIHMNIKSREAENFSLI